MVRFPQEHRAAGKPENDPERRVLLLRKSGKYHDPEECGACRLPETLTAAQKKAGDITGDGTVSADDVQLMLKYYTENTAAGKKLTWADLQKS